MKRRLAVPFAIAAAMASIFLSVAPASAQANRTYVSHAGDDDNNCSESSPCASFAGAIAKTTDRGEVDCLDSGEFGPLQIRKPITIDCKGSAGGIDNLVEGILINFDLFQDTHTPHVTLRNLSITGNRGSPGVAAIQMNGSGAGSIVNIENCIVSTDNENPEGSAGIFDGRSRGLLVVDNTTIQNNGEFGISVGSPDGSRRAVIRNTRIINSVIGIFVGPNSELVISHSEIIDNSDIGLLINASTGSATVDS